MATVRAIASARRGRTRPAGARRADLHPGVVLSKPVRSWTQPPIGQSDRPDSPHYADQAEKLFSPGKMKPTWYLKDDLLKHTTSRTELRYP